VRVENENQGIGARVKDMISNIANTIVGDEGRINKTGQ
jgi:hypothetical protein